MKGNHEYMRAFIQARMSSARFPGKVLAPLNGNPLISCLITRLSEVFPPHQIVVATSRQLADDPLVAYVKSLGIPIYRGSLDDVFDRFRSCLREYPCDWFFRVCADSPLLSTDLLKIMCRKAQPGVDLVTNVKTRTFPVGHSLELINAARFETINRELLSAEEREHMTQFYYRHPGNFKIISIEHHLNLASHQSLAVDTIEDLRRLEALSSRPRELTKYSLAGNLKIS